MSPWDMKAFKEKNKDFTDAQARVAMKVANKALETCIADGGDQEECEASAIKQGLSVGAKLKEGMLADEVNAQKTEQEINDFIRKAQSLVSDVMRDLETSTAVKKEKISGILDDLDSELTKRAGAVASMIKKRNAEKTEAY